MKQTTIDFIESNDELRKFVNKVHSLHNMLEDDAIRNMFFASLISADYLENKTRCCGARDELQFLTAYLDLITSNPEIKRKTTAFIADANKIVKKELMRYGKLEKKNAPQK